MSRAYLVYRCKEGEVLKKPEAVINLWAEDVPRFSEILDEATASRADKARRPGEYWEIVTKEQADPYDWEKVVGPIKNKEHDPLGDMWREKAKIEKLMAEGATLEQALEVMTPFSHTFRYESEGPKNLIPSIDDVNS
ncbi:hypothetical protein [Desulfomicrobium escambiense]|uniref:hypothetical protein n=1 Tax=Desulfomicrobium escambiense TaxID=29503 RepID=UPI0003FB78DD|nr:hypothetical protein [Desulfomicrobium escambiense]